MADKSPRSHMSQKGKSIKQKRADKQAKSQQQAQHEIIPPHGKR